MFERHLLKGRGFFILFYIISFIIFILSSSFSLAYVSESDIEILVGEDYFPAAREVITNARESVYLKMYLFTLDSLGEVLAKDLVEAHGRGVEVEVILNKGGGGNEPVYNYLKENRVNVRYDSPGVLTHSKMLVVDREIAIVGSQNWTRASLSLNNEAGILIKSKKISEGLLKGEVAGDDNVMTLNEGNYFTVLSEALQKAEESIHILVYCIEKGDTTQSLVQDLARVKERGVKIEIMLDQSFRDNLPQGKNITGIRLLRENGLDIKFDEVARITHAKLIVIDGEKIFLGSQNWLNMGEGKYDEDSLYVISKGVGERFIKFIDSIEASPCIYSQDEIGKGVKLSYSFLINESSSAPGVTLMDRRAGKAFRLYLMLLYTKPDETDRLDVSNEYESLGKYLGYDRSKIRDIGKYYRNYYKQHISRYLRILEKLKLIKFDAGPGIVTFLDPRGSGDMYVTPSRRYFVIPYNFWEYEWDKRLSFKGSYLYLIGLLERSLYPEESWWSRSYEGIHQLYKINPNTIWEAVLELQRYNLIEVYRDAWEPDEGFNEREKNKYHLNRFYSMGDFESEWKFLKQSYGEKIARDARALADELDEPYDLVVIEAFIGLIKDFSLDRVREANKITSSFRRSYGKRHFGYTEAILAK